MLTKKLMYKFMTVDQMTKRVEKIKKKLDKETSFDKRLDLLEELAIIVNVLLVRYKDHGEVMKNTREGIDGLLELVK